MCRSTERFGIAAGAALVGLALAAAAHAGSYPGVGRAATPAEVRAWDIDVRPDFKGLPPGSGSVAQGQQVWESKCESCHGTFGESNEVFTPIVGGTTAEDMKTGHVKALLNPEVQRTTLMKLSTVSTLWDYIRRAMPWNAPKSLSTGEVYAVVAYILNLGNVVPADFVLSDRNIAEVQAKLPNRNGMTREHGLWAVKGRPDAKNVACMKDCVPAVNVASKLPDVARGANGDLAQQNRLVGPVRGVHTPPTGAAAQAAHQEAMQPAAMNTVDLAKQSGCLNCHGVDQKIVGPAFREVARRYQGEAAVDGKLLAKVKAGGAGAWGQIPMPANPTLAEADAKAIVDWILAGAH